MPMQSVGELYRGMSLRDEMELRKREAMARQRDLGYQAQTPGYSRYATGAINDLAPSPLEAMAMSQIPGLSDAAGFAADARRMYDNPAERTWGNMGLAAAGALPFIPSGLAEPVAKAVKKLAPGDARMATAQRNASLPVADGGLGLPADNTAMQRAKAMGFDADAYHATSRDFAEFDPGKFSPSSKWGAAIYAGTDKDRMRLITSSVLKRDGQNDGARTIPLKIRSGNQYDAVSGDMPLSVFMKSAGENPLKAQGYDSVLDNRAVAVFDPKNVRSRFAAFDPMRRHESDLLGYADPRLLAALGIGGLGAAAAAPSLYDAWLGQEQQ